MCFQGVFLRREEKVQERATSIRGKSSSAGGLCMYETMKGVDGGSPSNSCETRLNTFFFTMRDAKERLHFTSGSFCSMWHVSCAPMSQSLKISVRTLWTTVIVGASGGEHWERRESIW